MKRVWVVEDTIPVHAVLGSMPQPIQLDGPVVKHILDAVPARDWREPPVMELCKALVAGEYEPVFFLNPNDMLSSLEQRLSPPHVVIFDWEYPGINEETNLMVLDQLLGGCFAYVQIYSHLDSTQLNLATDDLRRRYPGRLLPACDKADVDAQGLAERVRAEWQGTIAGPVADRVRRSMLDAVERTLVEMCGVPAGAFASISGGVADDLVRLVLSKVQEELVQDHAFDSLAEAAEYGDTSDAIRRFLSAWYYSFPHSGQLRRGDLIELGSGELGLIVTPECDLYRFAKKTGRRLTWIRVVPLDDGSRVRSAGLRLKNVGRSITARHPDTDTAVVVLPNVPGAKNDRANLVDYCLLCHAWESRHFPAPEEKKKGAADPPHYADAEYLGLERRCRLNEPFLSAVITHALAAISTAGTPDLPNGESARMGAVLAGKKSPS